MDVRECYRLLKVREGADLDEVKSAFRKMAFGLHPDLNPDNPHAARQFQRVNEAYVVLKDALEHEDATTRKRREASRKRAEGPSYDKAGKTRAKAQPPPPPPPPPPGPKAHPKEEEVLSDILKDPFARKVFEDIYSEIKKGGKPGRTPATPRKKRKLSLQYGEKEMGVDLSEGVWGGVKGWMRRQLDDEQTMYLEPQYLRPGGRVKLTIAHGLGAETRTVEVTLPPDFSVGKAMRLKGLGRSVGPWKGDLYLKLLARV